LDERYDCISTLLKHYQTTTVVDNSRELGNVYGNDGSELEPDEPCARKTNAG